MKRGGDRCSTWQACLRCLGFAGKVIPESPKWLRSRGKIDEAVKAENLLWGGAESTAAQDDTSKIEESEALLKSESAMANWIEALFDPRYRKGVWIGAPLFFAQQFAGINAVITFPLLYSPQQD